MADRLRLDGYIRVSRVGGREGPSFISPESQREQIVRWATLRGVEIAEWHTDLDQSGGKLTRPGLDAALERVRAKATGGIAVAKLDRLSRANVGDALRLVEELHELGAQLAVVDMGIDPTTVFGEFAMTLMLAMARMQRRSIAETWRDARERAVGRGVHVSSATPTGYRRREDGTLEADPVAGPAIRELFERRAAGESWNVLSRFLTDAGVRGPYDAVQWRPRAVQHLLEKRVYLGHAYSGEFVNLYAHEPLVDRATWLAAQEVRGPAAARGEPALLAGVLRCAGCRYVLKPDSMPSRDGGPRLRTYRCRGQHASGTCTARAAVMGRVVEPYVERAFLERVTGSGVESAEPTEDLAALEAAAHAAEIELAAYRDDERIEDALGRDRYVEGLRARAQRADDAYRALVEARAAVAPSLGRLPIGEVWPTLAVEERQRVLRSAIDCVFIRAVGRSNTPIEERTVIFWRGEGPDGLPRRGLRPALESFVWPGSP